MCQNPIPSIGEEFLIREAICSLHFLPLCNSKSWKFNEGKSHKRAQTSEQCLILAGSGSQIPLYCPNLPVLSLETAISLIVSTSSDPEHILITPSPSSQLPACLALTCLTLPHSFYSVKHIQLPKLLFCWSTLWHVYFLLSSPPFQAQNRHLCFCSSLKIMD